MTRLRIYGSDVPFCAWMRACRDLPSTSEVCGFVANDVDLFLHRYLVEIDKMGSREIQAMMYVEVKTRNGSPSSSQHDSLWKQNAFQGAKRLRGDYIRHFGVSILRLSGLTPDDSSEMRWGRFTNAGELCWREIGYSTLTALLRFELHPQSFEFRPFRRHHLKEIITTTVKVPLGFETEAIVCRTS